MSEPIIVSGVLGSRFGEITQDIPKTLITVKKKPIIEHIILNLKRNNIKKIILSVGYKANQIIEYCKTGEQWGVSLRYSVEKELLGTGGAVKLAAQRMKKPFFLLWGDDLSDIDLINIENFYKKKSTRLVMSLTQRQDVENFGVAKIEGEKIVQFIEKPSRLEAPSNFVNMGVYFVHPSLLDQLQEGKSSIERDLFEKIMKQEEVYYYLHTGQWFPINKEEELQKARLYFKEKII